MELNIQQLREVAIKLDYKHHHTLGAVKLREQLEAHCQEIGTTLEEVVNESFPDYLATETPNTPVEAPETLVEAPEIGVVQHLGTVEAKVTPSSIEALEKALVASDEVPTDEANDEITRLANLTFSDLDGTVAKKSEESQNKNAMRLVRCIVTCNNKNKTSYTGEIFTVRNAVLPEVKKYIAFGVAYHVPSIMLNMIKEKQYQMFRKEKQPNGTVITRSYLVPEYNVAILDPLTKAELEAIKKKQLAEGFTGE